MSLLGDIRTALKANLSTISANCNGYRMIPPPTPCFEIDFPEDAFVYDTTHSQGTQEFDLIVRGIVAVGDSTETQATLDDWLDVSGSSSVKAAIESDRTLNGNVDDLRVERATSPRFAEAGSSVVLFAEWTVHLLIST